MKCRATNRLFLHRQCLLTLMLFFELLININYTQGQQLILDGSTPTVTRGNSFQFKCTVTNTTLQEEQVSFTRDTTNVCVVNTTSCTPSQTTGGYTCGCVSGETQMYYANITSVAGTDDSDKWICTVSGISSNTISVDVQYPPSITSVPRNKDVREKNRPSIDCSSNITPGNPSSTSYRWTGPGGYSKTGAVLDRTVTRTQGGQYTCTATNTARLSDTAHVIISVQCGYSKTGAVLDRTVNRTQGGQYTCNATNTAGSDTAQVNINVQYAPTIRSVAGEKPTTENTSPNIDCSSNITPGNPSSTSYRWTGPGGYSKTGTVLDRTVTRTQGGQYTCTASNTAGSDTAQVKINVQYLDSPVMSISQSQVMENDSVQLVCNVTSSPTVQMTIRNVDNKTNLVDHVMTNSRGYVIDRAQCLHNGTYQCVVNNRGLPRTLTSTTSLNVWCSPRKDFRWNFIGRLVSDINARASMVVDVIANPLPTFTWWRYDDGQTETIADLTLHEINSRNLHSVLEVNISRSRDYGMYAVQIENNYGSTILQYELTSQSQPFPPTEVSFQSLNDRSLSLIWMSMYNGGAEQVFHLDYQEMDSDVNHQIQNGIADPGRFQLITRNISGLEANTTYLFTLYSTNIYGTSKRMIINATTALTQKPAPDNKDVLIIGLGVGLGICLLVLVAVTVVFFIYRRLARRKKQQSSETDQRNYTNLHHGCNENQGYVYEMINAKNPTAPPATYENVELKKSDDTSPIYENHPTKQADNGEGADETDSPVYVNHLSIGKIRQDSAL